MADYDFFDEDFFSDVSPGIPIEIPSIDISNIAGGFDLSGFGGGFDLSDMGIDSLFYDFGYGDLGDLADAFNFGDLSNITGGVEGFGDIADIIGQGAAGVQGIEGFGDIADIVGQGAAGIQGIEGFGDIADIVGQGAAGIQGIEGFGDVADIVGQGAAGIPGIEGFGDVADIVGQGATGITGIEGFGAAADEVGRGATGITGIEGFGEAADEVGQGSNLGVDPYEVDGRQGSRTEDTALQSLGVETDPYGIDGLQGSRTEETALTGASPGGKEVIKTDTKKDETKKDDTKKDDTKKDDTKTLLDTLLGGDKKNQAMLMALLGGLLGLLGKGSAPKLPVGYQGGIPKYTAARVPGRGVQYTRAAGGGLMDLAEGGTARYLRGGTDGMADKIKTSIDGKQPARLSHGEFVIPADVVSHLGNGNSDAGADVLYEMMSKVRKARTGNPKQGKQINPRQYTPA
jgi:hypothetical protein